MRVRYFCSHCHDIIDEIDLEFLDEDRLGLSALTEEERESIIRFDEHGRLCLFAICDTCHDHLQILEVRSTVGSLSDRPILH